MPQAAGPTIRSLRQASGIKTGRFAELAGISRQHMTNIESGYASPSIEALQRIAALLNVDVARIENGEVAA